MPVERRDRGTLSDHRVVLSSVTAVPARNVPASRTDGTGRALDGLESAAGPWNAGRSTTIPTGGTSIKTLVLTSEERGAFDWGCDRDNTGQVASLPIDHLPPEAERWRAKSFLFRFSASTSCGAERSYSR